MSVSGGISSCLSRHARNEIAVHRKLKLWDSGGELAPLWTGSEPRQSELSDRAQLTTDNAGEKEWHQRRLQEHWDSTHLLLPVFFSNFASETAMGSPPHQDAEPQLGSRQGRRPGLGHVVRWGLTGPESPRRIRASQSRQSLTRASGPRRCTTASCCTRECPSQIPTLPRASSQHMPLYAQIPHPLSAPPTDSHSWLGVRQPHCHCRS